MVHDRLRKKDDAVNEIFEEARHDEERQKKRNKVYAFDELINLLNK
ncbi:hypothetical protein KKG24_01985 [Patescibacteria group bacterium]|nr:hypothetical protein [Patescibacteria group bacterium]